jgi:acetylglutamate kinase
VTSAGKAIKLVKLGGELLETPVQRANIAAFAARLVASHPLAIVHGGGRAIDAALARRSIAPKKVDGLRITDAETLDAVVAVLAGSANTALVASLVAAGVRAVGLTGVDAGFGRATRVSAHRTASGSVVDLGLVGDPAKADPDLVSLLLAQGYVPVIASLGVSPDGSDVLNVNADVMACRLAAALGASELVIAGGTAGVLDRDGRTIASMDVAAIDDAIASGTATAGMIAKLSSCRAALADGVGIVRIVDGKTFDATHGLDDAPGTVLGAPDLQVRG